MSIHLSSLLVAFLLVAFTFTFTFSSSSKIQISFPPNVLPQYIEKNIVNHFSHVQLQFGADEQYNIEVHPFQQRSSSHNDTSTKFTIRTSKQSNGTKIDIFSVNRFSMLAGTFHLMRKFGVLHFHPLQVNYVPKSNVGDLLPDEESLEASYARIGSHIHSMHPLELTDFVNGFVDHSREVGTREQFAAILDSEWNSLMEWMVASKTNMLEWILLRVSPDYDKSEERMQRLALIVERAHDYGIFVGVDVPIALQQQHSWALIQSFGDKKKEFAQIEHNTNILAQANFDYITTELGFSEFTHGNATRMLDWLDELTRIGLTLGMITYTKAHISTGQTVPGWIDPVTKKDGMNFNFLPYYARKELGVMPHTVQFYAFDDPAHTYGNANFTHMMKYLEVELGRREVLYFPETAYWVNYDINAPLFLPLYVDRRLYDLRLLVEKEKATGKRMDGHIIFSSGWEFGYWLNDKLVNEMAFNRSVVNLERSHDEDLRDLLATLFDDFGDASEKLTQAFMKLILMQREYLIYGTVDHVRPTKTEKRAGQAYLEGWDTWSDLMTLVTQYFGKNIATQPDGLRIIQVRHGLDRVLDGPRYKEDVAPLLKEMQISFSASAEEIAAIRSEVAAGVLDLFDDLSDSVQLLALRATQVYESFEYASAVHDRASKQDLEQRKQSLSGIMTQARKVMDQRVAQFHAKNIGAWAQNPTAYPFYYLYQAKTLYFWWRDIAQAVFDVKSPCYLNLINPVDVSLGEGFLSEFVSMLREFLDKMQKAEWIADCLAA
eukprot:CAMPEP_0117447544 /NCGR_PEP_ID=MMETSP0759-20121206/6932_1 /TAXON_ID=63605 /ORGANISM="Percolomonas cosmopolitus, Strain WS" /LENGTH=773 /DNA_ID=CAMNT_0005239887 /DNA_START=24 /DNA_END=2341 /DNA_ORIENTATION=+